MPDETIASTERIQASKPLNSKREGTGQMRGMLCPLPFVRAEAKLAAADLDASHRSL